MKQETKKGSNGFWKKLSFVAGAVALVAVGALAEKKFGIVNATKNAAVKGFDAVKNTANKVFTKQPAVSNVDVETSAPAPKNNNYQGNNNYSRKYN
jgi:hypothetical protein